jgi:DNA polymerase III subunit epsilon
MPLILGLDFETTGTDLNSPDFRVIEVGAALFNEKLQLIESYSWLVTGLWYFNPGQGDNIVPNDVTRLTGIDSELVMHGYHPNTIDTRLAELIKQADYLCAHNHSFEKAILEKLPHSYDEYLNGDDPKPWIDTMTDLPNNAGAGTLTVMAANHRFINPFPHRALPDVLTMMAVLSQYDFDEVVRHATAPTVTLGLYIPYNGGEEQRATAKANGFKWNPDKKLWEKEVKDFNLEAEQKTLQEAGLSAR